MSAGESVVFWVVATAAVLCALGVVVASKAVYSALCLAATMILLAVAYLAQGAMFLGVVQIVVYTGAVMMLFLFVVMLVGVSVPEDDGDRLTLGEALRGHRVAAGLVGIALGLLLIGLLARATLQPRPGGREVGGVEDLADLVFVRYVWAFELTAALLITATVGAMALAHREKVTAALSQKEQSILRFAAGHRATPLPNPGVYALGNSVDLPGRLPDGSAAPDSVNRTLTPRDPGRGVAEPRKELT